MLILTRRKGEMLMIGDDIQIMVSDVKGNQVTIGIKAPKEVQVDREEIYLLKQTKELPSTEIKQPTKNKNAPYPSDSTRKVLSLSN